MPTSRAIHSLVTRDGQLRLSIEKVEVRDPGPGEILVRMEAAPINPSDLGLMFGPADPKSFRREGTAENPVLVADIPAGALAALENRLGTAIPVGNEGAGRVIAAGPDLAHIVGRTVALLGGGTYQTLRSLRLADALLLPEGAAAVEGASLFVNPQTALGFVETMRAEGHTAMIHTAAASNLGQMLLRISQADGFPLVAIVRSESQAALLKGMGAEHVVDMSAPDFDDALVEAIVATGAMLAFDAVGGGDLASRIIAAMEGAALRMQPTPYNRYGSNKMKQVFIYGALDPAPTVLHRVGYAWKLDGWLLTNFMGSAGAETIAAMRRRIVEERLTTFASSYTATIGLADMLNPDIAMAYERKGTGAKYLVDPSA